MEEVKLNAHAKLNLSLRILGRRDDGYHIIESWMQGIGLCDVISIKKCPQNGTKYNFPHCTINGHVVYLCTDEKTIPTDMNNLALKGMAALMENPNTKLPDCDFIVEIDKRLPVAAGIAGGSGNAAAAMLGLNALTGFPLTLREIMSAGSGVGADVPFSVFMNAAANEDVLRGMEGLEEAGCAAMTGGIGDVVEAREPLARHVIMANPGIHVSTSDAYHAIDSKGYGSLDEECEERLFVNDLEGYTLETYPEANDLKKIMRENLRADEVLMSGSGPTIAAYYTDDQTASEDAETLTDLLTNKDGHRLWLTTTGI